MKRTRDASVVPRPSCSSGPAVAATVRDGSPKLIVTLTWLEVLGGERQTETREAGWTDRADRRHGRYNLGSLFVSLDKVRDAIRARQADNLR